MISVCMATYNGERFLRPQVESILSQLEIEDELVVSDDGSTDKTVSILESFHDPRIKIHQNTGRHGVNGNFENALRHSKGDYIFLSDQDDIWLEDKVKNCLKALEDSHCIVHDCKVIDSDGNIISESFFKDRNSGAGFWKNVYKNSYLGCCMAFRRCVLDYALPYPEDLPIFQEGWLATLAEVKGKVKFIPEKGILYRRHGSNASFTAEKSEFSLGKKISYRLRLLYLISKHLLKRREKWER